MWACINGLDSNAYQAYFITSSIWVGKGGGGNTLCFSEEMSLIVPTPFPNDFAHIGILPYFFSSVNEQVITWRYSNLFSLLGFLARIWANQPIHSVLVGCLSPCLQGTNVQVVSSQPLANNK